MKKYLAKDLIFCSNNDFICLILNYGKFMKILRKIQSGDLNN